MKRKHFLEHIKRTMPGEDMVFIDELLTKISNGETVLKGNECQMAMRLSDNYYLKMYRDCIWKDGNFRGYDYEFFLPDDIDYKH